MFFGIIEIELMNLSTRMIIILFRTLTNIKNYVVQNRENGAKQFEHIQGIVVDVKYLMGPSPWRSKSETLRLAQCTENSLNNK